VAQVEALGLAATQAGVSITVLPEVDIGQGRCGVKGNDALAALVDRIVAHKGLRFGGLQAYHGGIQHLASWEQRRQAAETAAQATAQYVQFLAARGIACDVITGGGTGTAEFDVSSGVYTEIQPGSYVFMDGDYGSKDWQGGWKPAHSLFIASTVMSTGKPGMAVCDVGRQGSGGGISGCPCCGRVIMVANCNIRRPMMSMGYCRLRLVTRVITWANACS